jgi:hypothetical protein
MTKTKFTSILLVLFLAMSASSCYTLNHTVGKGAQGSDEKEHRVWFALWGLIPLGEFDSKQLAGDANNYTVKTQVSPVDFLISIFTGWVTIYPRTVTVTK